MEAEQSQESLPTSPPPPPRVAAAEREMGFPERAVAAAGAAFVSAVLVNPLDVAKTRLQAQAAGVVYNPVGIYLSSYDLLRNWIEEYSDCSFPKLRPYAPLIAGSIARSLACVTCSPIELARTRMQAFKESNVGGKPPGMWKTLLGVLSLKQSINHPEYFRSYHLLWTGLGAQLARDVPFSAICWTILEPTRRHLIGIVGEQSNAAVILGANFSAGFIAGVFSAGATCPLDVAKTRKQIDASMRLGDLRTQLGYYT